MAIRRVFNGKTIRKPGSYSALKVQNLTGFPLQPTGIVGIVGESVGGEPGVLDVLQGTQIQSAKARYKSGPIADALGLLVEPSNDARIANGASTVIIWKTNNSTKAVLGLANNEATPLSLVDLETVNYGADENNANVDNVSVGSITDLNAIINGTIDGPFDLSGGSDTLIVTINGTVYTFTSLLTGAAETTSAIETELNTDARWSPSRPVTASANGLKVDIEILTSVLTTAKLDFGYISVSATSTLDTILGIAGTDRGRKGSRYITLKKGSLIEDAEQELGGVSQIQILYTGAAVTSTLTIADAAGDRKLTTSCAATPADDLDFIIGKTENGELVSKMTLQELVDVINAHASYTCTLTGPNGDLDSIELDYYNAINIETVALDLKRDVQDFVDFLTATSDIASAARITNVDGALATFTTPAFFTGGTNGVSANSDYANGFEAFETVRINIVVPLISEDAGAVTISSVNALAKSHVIKMWGTSGKSERNAYVSVLGSKTEFKAMAAAMSSAYVSICGQDPLVYSYSQKQTAYLDPWAQACIKAGLQAGSEVGEPNTFKLENVSGYRVRDGSWEPKLDYDELIEANCQLSEPLDTGGYRDVVGNTTYGVDPSFVWNRVSVVEAGGFVAYDLRYNLEALFTGTKAKTGTAESIANLCKARFEVHLKADIIVGDDLNDGLGYKNLKVVVEGNTASIDVIVTPVQGLDFALPTIYLADIQQSA